MQSVWADGMLSQGHMVSPLYHYTGQVDPRFGESGSIVEWKWCHNLMVEADIHLRLLHTSILDLCKVFELLVCCLKAIWCTHTITPAKLTPDLGSQGHLWSENDAKHHGWGWYSPRTTSYIYIRHIKCVWAIVMLTQGRMVSPIPLHWPSWPQIWEVVVYCGVKMMP